ncbi:MAG: transferase [Lachnospiraceae bacterium]|nr:transferase [Lachnospiraceae bacterium]
MADLVGGIKQVVKHQLVSLWGTELDESVIDFDNYCRRAFSLTENALKISNNKYYKSNGFSIFNSIHNVLFLYYLSHIVGCEADHYKEQLDLADQIYYLNKMLNGCDFYWGIELPTCFLCEHPVGTVLGRAMYGGHVCVYQGCTIGGNRKNGAIDYPVLGDYVLLYANASVIGKCNIGNNVIISANTTVLNKDVPDDTIVYEKNGNLFFKELDDARRRELFGAFWNDLS